MASGIEDVIRNNIGDRSAAFVFPSEAAADSWARASTERFGVAAVETGRFLGWDRFKEALLGAHRTERPSDRLSRTVWAAGLLARQAEKPFLRRILGPGKPSPAFVSFLAALPPSLSLIASRIELARGRDASGRSILDDESLKDYLVLHRDYSAFLKDKSLFEPAWEPLSAAPRGARYILLYPRLMEDFEDYRAAIEGMGAGVEIAEEEGEHSGGGATPLSLNRFPNSFEEFRWVFLEVGKLLDGGMRPEEIAVTVADLDASSPHVESAAELAGVPVELRNGKPLSASAFGRLLGQLAACASSGFGFDEMRALLLDNFVAWKGDYAEAARALVRFGIDRHAYASFREGSKNIDIWEESFAVCGARPELRAFYKRLKASLESLAKAEDFGKLRERLIGFRESFLDETGWKPEEQRTLERIMVELASLARAERELGAAGHLPSPFDLFRRVLETQRYVHKSAGPSVPVYPYRVSALLAVKVHFIASFSQEAARVNYSSLPFIREDQKENLGAEDRDASDDFAAAYAEALAQTGAAVGLPATGDIPSMEGSAPLRSGAPKSAVVFSYSEQGQGGWSAPSPFFLGGASAGSPIGLPPGYDATRRSHPLAAETASWSAGTALPAALLDSQKRAARRAGLGDEGKGYGERGCRASSQTRDIILGRRRSPTGSLRLSATELEEYLACPFAWLLSRGLRLSEEKTGIEFFDARLAGEMAHAAVRRLFAGISELGDIDMGLKDGYLGLVGASVAGVLPAFARDKGPFLLPMFSAYAPLLEDRLGRLVEAESWMEGWETGEFEIAMSKEYPEAGAILEGRADRVARLAGTEGYAIIDYKKKVLPKKKDLYLRGTGESGEEESGAADWRTDSAEEEGIPASARSACGLGKLQIAAYIALCEACRGKVERAAYWSIECAKRLIVVGAGGAKSREEYQGEIGAFERALALVASGIRSGDFGLASSRGEDCGGCDWKAVCRSRYATE